MEQYVDFSAQTTVASGGYTAASGVLNVRSTAAPFPQSGTFRVIIQNATTNATEVLLIVTGVNSSTQWVVEAEGTDADAFAGDNVYAVLSAGALTQIRSDSSMTGTYADLPGTVPVAGTRYKCTDVPYEFVSNGSAWLAWWMGVPVTVPPLASSFSTAGSGTIASASGTLLITGYLSNYSAFTVSSPSVPFTFEIGLYIIMPGNGGIGLCTSDGTKYEYFALFPGSSGPLSVQYNSALNTYGSGLFSQSGTLGILPGLLFLKMVLDSSHRTYYIGDGTNWVQVFQESHTANLTTSEIGIAIYGGTETLPVSGSVVHFSS
jgi:hypothetical protein